MSRSVHYTVGRSESKKEFTVLLFAGDINVYSVSRAFYEAYGVVPRCYGKYPSGPCMHSRIVDYSAEPKADDCRTFVRLVQEFAEENKKRKVLLIGCGDNYVELAAQNRSSFPENVIVPYIDVEQMRTLNRKEAFYSFCDAHGVEYPATVIHRNGKPLSIPFAGPYVVKPSNGIEYWNHPYAGQKKVYTAETAEEVDVILRSIYGSGYSDSVVVQKFVPGNDSCMRVLTGYSDRNGKVVMMCLGHVLLEEHTPHGIGNHALILTECDRELMEKYRALLEGIHYTGFSNFDIKYDSSDRKYKAFELNTRQGRSNYYVTASGANIARLLVRDRIDRLDSETVFADKENLWTVLPKAVALRYADPSYKTTLRQMFSRGKWCNPLLNRCETHPLKLWQTSKNLLSHFYKYRKYMPKQH